MSEQTSTGRVSGTLRQGRRQQPHLDGARRAAVRPRSRWSAEASAWFASSAVLRASSVARRLADSITPNVSSAVTPGKIPSTRRWPARNGRELAAERQQHDRRQQRQRDPRPAIGNEQHDTAPAIRISAASIRAISIGRRSTSPVIMHSRSCAWTSIPSMSPSGVCLISTRPWLGDAEHDDLVLEHAADRSPRSSPWRRR